MKPHCSTCRCFSTRYNRVTYIYKAWDNIRFRLLNKNSPDYKNYGGRGIGMLPDWIDNYILFQKYILENIGERPIGHSLDRIDNNYGYYPGNLKWSTYSDQLRNRRKFKRNV